MREFLQQKDKEIFSISYFYFLFLRLGVHPHNAHLHARICYSQRACLSDQLKIKILKFIKSGQINK